MSYAIWKYPLQIVDRQLISVPNPVQALSVDFQGETLCLWYEVRPGDAMIEIEVRIVGTGHPYSFNQFHYVGTVQQLFSERGNLVWHVFVCKVGWKG